MWEEVELEKGVEEGEEGGGLVGGERLRGRRGCFVLRGRRRRQKGECLLG